MGPQVAHIVDTVNIMAYDEGSINGKPIKLNFTTILDNFATYGNVTRSKINMGFEPGPQAAHGKWEGGETDEAAAREIAQKHIGEASHYGLSTPVLQRPAMHRGCAQ